MVRLHERSNADRSLLGLRPLTHTPEIGAINSTPDSGASFRADVRLLTSLTAFGAQRQSTTLDVALRHEKLAPESGVEFRPMVPIFAAGFWSVCQGSNTGQRTLTDAGSAVVQRQQPAARLI